MAKTPSRIAATVLRAGDFGLLVLGIPIPVFSYMGDDDRVLQRHVVELLIERGGAALPGGRRVELHSFSRCFGAVSENEILGFLPRFRSANGARKAAYLGVQLVTILPLREREMAEWPALPPEIAGALDGFRQALPALYHTLDEDLARFHDAMCRDGIEPGNGLVEKPDPP